ncbi:hypothetical protein [Streptomyces rugosispiralis]|uniref:Uncharacterized protein n=1 Tax=Streptomyces rugosispiralis TaxID=2967341 RepID=A0ABT1UZX8_9ACTN|nr:hypothetical protein [Streptomyces rugosispiralis]MCQ8190685.1 hypothetical protein [Streptomyces rugosispiralis]
MLPTEPPLSLHRLLAPVPPARPQETATATRQNPAPAPTPAKPPTPVEHLLMAGHHQVGNAAVADAAARTNPVTHPPTGMVVPPKPMAAQPS